MDYLRRTKDFPITKRALQDLPFLHQTYLFHEPDLIIVEPFFRNLSTIIPSRNRTEFYVKTFPGWGNHLAIGHLHRAFHRAVKVSNRTSVVSLTEKNLVWPVYEMVVWKCLEKLYRFQIVIVSASRGFRLARPVYRNILGVPLPKRLPIVARRPRIPRVVERLHQVQKIF
jgi:hypothetical protein